MFDMGVIEEGEGGEGYTGGGFNCSVFRMALSFRRFVVGTCLEETRQTSIATNTLN